MNIHPTHLTIGALFGHDRVFRVPKYQRHYAWTSEEIGDLRKDLDLCLKARVAGTRRHHFFGGLVTVSTPQAGTARQNLEVIDGQQRLASFVMLVVQLRRAMLKLANDVDKSKPDAPHVFLQDKAATLRERFERHKDTINLQVVDIARLELSKPDKDFYADLIAGNNPLPQRQSHELLKAAFESLGKQLDSIVSSAVGDLDKARALARVAEVLEDDWTVIHMATQTRAEAYMLFQVLNDRGMGLTEGELLRAKTLELLDSGGTAEQQRVAEQAWDHILAATPERVEEGLRWVYASRRGTRPGKTTLFDDFLAALFPMHLTLPLPASDAAKLVKTVTEIELEFEKMAAILQGEWPYPVQTPITAWDRDRLRMLIVELKHTNCMPLLIAATALDHKRFSDIVQMLERFVLRYKIVVDAHIGPATSVYQQQAVQIRTDPAKYKVSSLQLVLRQLLQTSANDGLFMSRLGELRYSKTSNNKAIKYLLMTLEHYARWYEDGANGRPTCKDKTRIFDFPNATVEHVYPQNSPTKDPALEPLVDTLGNLTFLGPNDNDAAGHKNFAQKKPIFAKSNVSLNQEIATAASWDALTVKKRQQKLLEMASKTFVV